MSKEIVKLRTETVYTCNFCGNVYANEEEATKHLEVCLLNVVDNSTCVTCKYAVVNKQPMTAKDAGYDSLRLRELLGTKNYMTCGKGAYEGKLKEDIILREDKKCFVRADYDDPIEMYITDEYKRWEKLSQNAVDEQDEVDEETFKERQELQEYTQELKDKGLTDNEIAVELEKYIKEKIK